jgi:hypothetical protein
VHAAVAFPLVSYIEHLPIGREFYVYRIPADIDRTRDLHFLGIHLRYHPAPFAAGEQVVALRREVQVVHAGGRDVDAAQQSPRVGVAELECLQALDDHDCLLTVWSEVEVVGVGD